jgi:LEA14-like dessication related protein
MRWRLRLGSSLGMGLTSALTGCALLTQSPPQVDVANVALTGIGLFNQSLSVTLCVTNPNRAPIAFDRVTFRIAVANAPLADGVTESAVAIPASTSVLVPIAVQTTIRNLAAQLMSTLETGSIAYRLSGVVQLANLPFGVPFSREGHLTLLQAGEQYADMTAVPGETRCQLSPPIMEPVQ